MRAPPVAVEQIPIKRRLLDHRRVRRVPACPRLLKVRVFVDERRQAGGLAVGAGPRDGVEDVRRRDYGDSEVEGRLEIISVRDHNRITTCEGRASRTDPERFGLGRGGVVVMAGTGVSARACFTGGGGETTPDCEHVVVSQLAVTTEQLGVEALRLKSQRDAVLLLDTGRAWISQQS